MDRLLTLVQNYNADSTTFTTLSFVLFVVEEFGEINRLWLLGTALHLLTVELFLTCLHLEVLYAVLHHYRTL